MATKRMRQHTKKNIFKLIGLVLAVAFTVLSAWILTKTKISNRSKASETAYKITITPTKIRSNDGYKLTIKDAMGNPFTGNLDYDLTYCPLKIEQNPSNCRTTTGQWTWGDGRNQNGIYTIQGELNLKQGYYLVRYKPRGEDDSFYSNFDLQVVENADIMPANTYTSVKLPMPPRGSYSILENRDPTGKLIGYTRFDVETDTDPTLCGGDVWRYSKSQPISYWSPNVYTDDRKDVIKVLRWCVKQLPYENKTLVRAIDGKVYPFNKNDALSGIKVKYSSGSNFVKGPALLGGFMKTEIRPWLAEADTDMPFHYMLYPLDGLIPKLDNLPKKPQKPLTMISTAVGHPLENLDDRFDAWHVEMFKPDRADSVITFRQVEEGWADRMATLRWKVTEDWTFNANGLFTEIKQWDNTPSRCWQTPTYECENGRLNASASMIESYIPNNQPLKLSLAIPGVPGESGTTNLVMPNEQTYELRVTQSDGTTPYSGFLEIKMKKNGNQMIQMIWRDAAKRPIYVHRGSVIVPKEAYGNQKNFKNEYAVRPYLINSSINGLVPTTDWGSTDLITNASTAQFSNYVTHIVGTPAQ